MLVEDCAQAALGRALQLLHFCAALVQLKSGHAGDARGLRSIIESVMLDIQYELPDLEKKGKFVVTEEVVMGLKPLFEKVDLPSEATLPNETKLSA